jgi:hypothetical protein
VAERLYTPAPMHNALKPWGLCGCVACSRRVLAARCPYRTRRGGRCGDYRDHRGGHSPILATAFAIAQERVRLDAP